MTKLNRWMPLDWGDYWRDTAHLTAAEHGAYLNLLGAYWVSGAPLPDDDARLSRLARTTLPEWRRVRGTVRAFFRVADGALHHGRVDREIARAIDVTAGRAERISKLNAKRYATSPSPSSSMSTSSSILGATSSTTSTSISSSISTSILGATSSTTSTSISRPHLQSPPQSSGPTGPAAEAAVEGGGDVIAGAPASLKARIFGPCLTWLAAQSHIPEARARTLTARWCAKFGDGAVLDAFTAAARQSPLDPVPYIEKVLNNGPLRIAGSHDTGSIHTRRQRDAKRAAGDHLAGLRAALGAGGLAGVSESTADPQPHQPDQVGHSV